ncbi:MAG TPA: GNAT family N-acetyltransferase [Streptosporangiaceae bacterium]|nr:GNAT family N-acetyltransferase [Streptosporangiaceae bacterium]
MPPLAVSASRAAAGGHPAAVVTLAGPPAAMAVQDLAAALAAVAEAAFGAPPWNEPAGQARMAVKRMLDDAGRTGFVLALARAPRGAPLDGFAYGLPRWHLAALADRHVPGGAAPFEFRELAVRPAAQGKGIGTALHDGVIAASGPQRRWLATHAGARPALSLYRNRGWHAARLIPGSADGSMRLLMTRAR